METFENKRLEKRERFVAQHALSSEQAILLNALVEDFNSAIRKSIHGQSSSGSNWQPTTAQRELETIEEICVEAMNRISKVAPGLDEKTLRKFIGFQMDWATVRRMAEHADEYQTILEELRADAIARGL